MTAAGALPALLGRSPTRELRDMSLGFAAGVMLAASFPSRVTPALDAAAILHGDGVVPPLVVRTAIPLGMGAVAALDETLPHERFAQGPEGPEAASLRRV